MIMKPSDKLLMRMLHAAREARTDAIEHAPSGFAARVAAGWARQADNMAWLPLWERICGRAALGMTLAAVIAGVSVWQGWTGGETNDALTLATQLNALVFVP